ncbi:MAG: TIGR02679 domain-containing protein, partial [Nocardioidaceae bacterium]
MSQPCLPDWVADPALSGVWARVRTRFEAAGLVADGRTVVSLASRSERHALGNLLGRPVMRQRVAVDLAELDARLHARSGVGGLAEVLRRVSGADLVDRPGRRAAIAARREEPLELARELIGGPWVADWLAGLRRSGLLSRREHGVRIVREAAGVLDAVLGTGGAPRSRTELAAHVV